MKSIQDHYNEHAAATGIASLPPEMAPLAVYFKRNYFAGFTDGIRVLMNVNGTGPLPFNRVTLTVMREFMAELQAWAATLGGDKDVLDELMKVGLAMAKPEDREAIKALHHSLKSKQER